MPQILTEQKALVLTDLQGNNTVKSVKRINGDDGRICYEIIGINNKNEQRILQIYENGHKYLAEINGKIAAADDRGVVHLQMEKNLPLIRAHFGIPSFDFHFPITLPSPPLPRADELSDEDIPSKAFFIQAAKRALEQADKVAAHQQDAHNTRGIFTGGYDEGSTSRLDLLNELVSEKKNGFYPFAATTAYGISFITYMAINYDKFTKDEIKRLYQLCTALSGKIPPIDLPLESPECRLALANGLKGAANEVTALREKISINDPKAGDDFQKYVHDLVLGNPNGRPVVDKRSSQQASGFDGTSLTRPILPFFPVPPDAKSIDQIVLSVGGCTTHSVIVTIWKQGFDADGNLVSPGDGKEVKQYKVYRTIANAGWGATSTVESFLYHLNNTFTAKGQLYSICTQEVLLKADELYSHDKMQAAIMRLVEQEVILTLRYNYPGQNGEKGTAPPHEVESWKSLNNSIPLGPVEEHLSVLGDPQRTGNCTARSIKEYLKWEAMRTGASSEEASRLVEGHWAFAGSHNSASTRKLLNSTLEPKPHATTPPSTSKSEINLVNVENFFKVPTIPKFPTYLPDIATDLDTQSLVDDIRSTNTNNCPKPNMMLINDLLKKAESAPTDKTQTGIGYHLLQGWDSRTTANFTCMQGAIRQVASQFNNGESPYRGEIMPNKFSRDRTQGPSEQRTSGGAAIARFAHNKACDCLELLRQKPNFDQYFDYQYGYLTPKPGEEEAGVKFLKEHIGSIALNVERVVLDGKEGQTAIQILNSGLALGRKYDTYFTKRKVENRPFLKQMTELILTAQYEAVASVAILEAQQNPSKRIPVIFTLIGGGAFENDPLAIAKSLSLAIKRIKNSGINNVDVCLSIYNPSEIAAYRELVKDNDECSDLRSLLGQVPVNPDENMKALPAPKKVEAKPVIPIPSEQVNDKIVYAMNKAIEALSVKCHLTAGGRSSKKMSLEVCLESYKNSTSKDGAKIAIVNFVIEASKQRKSSWGSLFTSKFAETASLKAFFKHMNTPELKKILYKATELSSINSNNPCQFKKFAQLLRNKFEQDNKSPTHSTKP